MPSAIRPLTVIHQSPLQSKRRESGKLFLARFTTRKTEYEGLSLNLDMHEQLQQPSLCQSSLLWFDFGA